MNYKETLKGIFPPITTPFQNDELALDRFAENIQKYNETDLSGYVVFGSNGESVFLTSEEKLILISAVKEHADSNKKIIAGTGLESIKDTIFLTNNARINLSQYIVGADKSASSGEWRIGFNIIRVL